MYGKGKVKVLADKTFEEFNIRITELNPGSHKKIFVHCERCNEIFLRERRKLHQFHACPVHVVRDGKKLKWCNRCKQFLTYNCFNRNKARYDDLNSWCKTCCSEQYQKKHKFTGRESLEGWMKSFLSSKKSRCKKIGMVCDITIKDLQNLWASQNGRCYYSKIPLKFGIDDMRSANLDRVDSSGGYIINNIVWASQAMNNMKNHHSHDALLSFLESMVFTNVRLECKLDEENSKLPFRKRDTDAAHDVASIINTTILPGEVVNVKTGLRVSPPEGFYITVDGRSSLFKEGIIPFRGIIDSGYTGPLLIALYNSSNKPFKVDVGDRIAQITIHKVLNIDFVEVEEFSPEYSFRGEAGWGSSGRK